MSRGENATASVVSVGETTNVSLRSTLWWIAVALGISAFTVSLWQMGFAQFAKLKLGLPEFQHGRALGGIALVREFAAILTAFTLAFLYNRRQAFEWITFGLLLLALAFGLGSASQTIQDFRASQIVNEVGRVLILVTGVIWVNESAIERKRGKWNSLLFFALGLATALTYLTSGFIFSKSVLASELSQWLVTILILILSVAMAFALWTSDETKNEIIQVPRKSSDGSSKKRSGSFKFALTTFGLSGVATIFVSTFLLLWVVNDAAGSLDAKEALSLPVVGVAVSASFTGLVIVGILSLVVDRINRLGLTLFLCAMIAVGFLGIGTAPGVESSSLLLSVLIATMGLGGLPVASLTLLGQEAQRHQHARHFAMAFAFLFVSQFLASSIGGLVYDGFGGQSVFLIGGLLFAAATFIGIAVYRNAAGPSVRDYRSPNYQPQSGRA